ncbi:MAG: pirin family protein [Sporomusaceae bacterium]|jgi:redox-sensitive bicupin YhaK (pirin superfamily)|nr:pirin family protein [Sporomusaceae bacterium]
MLKYVDHKKMGRSQLGWLDSHFHFSFAEYYNPQNIRFGVLRVFNDDIIRAQTGFGPHPHQNMEIVTYVVQGEVSHEDSMGNAHALTRGQVQYMSAGTGIFHSEYNRQENADLRLTQIWILPDNHSYTPNYGDYSFALEDRFNKWLPIVTGYHNPQNTAPVKIHQDVNMYAAILDANKSIDFQVGGGRQAYLVCLEGGADVGGIHLQERDALEIIEEDVTVTTSGGCHLLVIEMAYDNEYYKKFNLKKTLQHSPLSRSAKKPAHTDYINNSSFLDQYVPITWVLSEAARRP